MKNILMTFIVFMGLAACCNIIWAGEKETYELVGFYEYTEGRNKIEEITKNLPEKTEIKAYFLGRKKSIAIIPKDNGSLITLQAPIEKILFPKIKIDTLWGMEQETGVDRCFPFNISSQSQVTENDMLQGRDIIWMIAKKEAENRVEILFTSTSKWDFELQRDNALLEKLREKNRLSQQTPTATREENDEPRERTTTIRITPLKIIGFVALAAAIWNFDQVKTYFSQFMNNLWQTVFAQKANN